MPPRYRDVSALLLGRSNAKPNVFFAHLRRASFFAAIDPHISLAIGRREAMLDDREEERSRFGAQVYIGLALCAGIVAWLAYVSISKLITPTVSAPVISSTRVPR
jgi:hypothetical protein